MTDKELDSSVTPGRSTSSLSRRWERFPKSFRSPIRKSRRRTTTETNRRRRPTMRRPSEDEKPASKPAEDQLKVKDLALTKDATDIEYKEMVEHVLFKSKASTKASVPN